MKINELSISERILLAEQLWDSVIAEDKDIEIPETQITELDKRLASYNRNKDIGSPWIDVKNRILGNQ